MDIRWWSMILLSFALIGAALLCRAIGMAEERDRTLNAREQVKRLCREQMIEMNNELSRAGIMTEEDIALRRGFVEGVRWVLEAQRIAEDAANVW